MEVSILHPGKLRFCSQEMEVDGSGDIPFLLGDFEVPTVNCQSQGFKTARIFFGYVARPCTV